MLHPPPLGSVLTSSDICVVIRYSNTDTQIVRCALELSSAGSVFVFADNLDIILPLLYYWSTKFSDVHVLTRHNTFGIERSQSDLADIKPHLFFTHTISGRGITSAFYGKGKSTTMKPIKGLLQLKKYSTVLTNNV